jgi:hypothetical protein
MPGLCDMQVPDAYTVGDGHTASCFLYR